MEVNDYISKIDLFSYYRAFFNKHTKVIKTIKDEDLGEYKKEIIKPSDWDKMTDKCKMSHSFMIIRAISAKYPNYMQELNKNHNVYLLDCLHNAFSKPNGKPPRWMYIKTKNNNKKGFLDKVDNEIIENYLKINEIEYGSLEFAMEHYPEKVKKDLNKMEKEFKKSWTKK